MKNKILEVQNYFINKITACDFDLEMIEFVSDERIDFNINIDGFKFNFCINPIMQYFCFFSGFMEIVVPNDRLSNIFKLIESKKEDERLNRIERLKSEIEKLQKA